MFEVFGVPPGTQAEICIAALDNMVLADAEVLSLATLGYTNVWIGDTLDPFFDPINHWWPDHHPHWPDGPPKPFYPHPEPFHPHPGPRPGPHRS